MVQRLTHTDVTVESDAEDRFDAGQVRERNSKAEHVAGALPEPQVRPLRFEEAVPGQEDLLLSNRDESDAIPFNDLSRSEFRPPDADRHLHPAAAIALASIHC